MRALILAPFEENQIDRLRRLGLSVTHESWLDTRAIHDPEILGRRLAAERTAILVVEADFVFEETFAAAPSLRLVAVCRNALNHIDLESAAAHGVVVTHAVGRNTNAVAEMTIGLMLALARRVAPAYTIVATGAWRDPSMGYREFRGREIAGSTVGVLGFGQIGREVARKCVALGARVVAHDPIVPEADMRTLGVEPMSTADLLAAADFVTLHLPEDASTHHLVDVAFLASMKPGALLINTGAGASVDPKALAAALSEGTIAGAALDVFEGQPLPATSPLLSAPNLLLTPHIGGATDETIERHSRIVADEVERFIAGEQLLYAVTPVTTVARAH